MKGRKAGSRSFALKIRAKGKADPFVIFFSMLMGSDAVDNTGCDFFANKLVGVPPSFGRSI